MNHKVQSGPAVRVFHMSGKLRFKKTLADIFTAEEIERFETGSYGIDWFREAWIDEVQKKLVIIAAEERKIGDIPFGLPDHQRIRVIDLKTGNSTLGGEDEVLQAISTKNPTGLKFAIELAGQMKIKSAIPLLVEFISRPIRTRIA